MLFLQLHTEIRSELVQSLQKYLCAAILHYLKGNKKTPCLPRMKGHPEETQEGERGRAEQMRQQGLASPLASAVCQAEGYVEEQDSGEKPWPDG